MLIKWQAPLLVLLLVVALGFLVRFTCPTSGSQHIVHESQTVRVRMDTARAVVTLTPSSIHVRGASTQTTTVIHDTPFQRFTLDTILVTDTSAINPDTLSVCYTPRTDSFDIHLRFGARRKEVLIPYLARDSLYSRVDSVVTSRDAEKRWYDDILLVVAAVVAWFMLTKL